MADFNLLVTSASKVFALILIILISIGVLIAPTLAPEKFALPLQAAGIAACFAHALGYQAIFAY